MSWSHPSPAVPNHRLPLHQSASRTRCRLLRLYLLPLRTLLQNSPSSSRSLLFSSKVIFKPRGPIRLRPLASPIIFQDASGVTVLTTLNNNVLIYVLRLKMGLSDTIMKTTLSTPQRVKKYHQCSIVVE